MVFCVPCCAPSFWNSAWYHYTACNSNYVSHMSTRADEKTQRNWDVCPRSHKVTWHKHLEPKGLRTVPSTFKSCIQGPAVTSILHSPPPILLLHPFYTSGSEGWCQLPKVTQLVGGRPRIWTQALWFWTLNHNILQCPCIQPVPAFV